MADYARQAFLNVPFDRRYQKLLNALVFAVHSCTLYARCAREYDDGGQIRLDKLYTIISECQFGIHDLSRTTLDTQNRLPRFNMPLELGLFLGARHFGGVKQRDKRCLILDREPHRYQKFCSDIAGQDISAHHNEAAHALRAVRNWLQTHLPPNAKLPSASVLAARYIRFQQQLPFMCATEGLDKRDLTFIDYRSLVDAWIEVNPVAA